MEQNILKGAEAEFLKGSNDIGVLVIHGFTGTTQSMRLVANALHKNGFTVNMPRLKGHGTTPEDMESCTYNDWKKSVSDAYDELKPFVKEIFVLGLSMGGTLTLYSAINFPIKGAIIINGAVDVTFMEEIYKNLDSPRFIDGIGSDIKKEGVIELAYEKTPKKSVKEIVNFTNEIRKELNKIVCPILIFSSTEDHVVPPVNAKYIYNHVSSQSKELIELENSYHVATLDNDLDIIVSKTLEFIQANL
ncbi:alpha/beta hydrolase [Chishuiella sp.]|uniref:alpha/beta hydrolase n=1 Tax=Chishuiella sp. TaxID=1969467 RepID=UPI0028A86C93|nr:alpha/beta fold hydrolase [Chishuiella sp.]